jgi:hypothetical protein
MTVRVPQAPEYAALAPLRVGQPIAAGHGAHWSEELAFLLGGCLNTVVSQTFPARAVSGTATYHVAYKRSAGAQVLLVEIEIPVADDAAGRCTVEVSCTTGTIAILEATGGSPLDGATELPAEPAAVTRNTIHRGIVSVASLAYGTIHDLVFTVAVVTSTSTVYPRSLYRLHVVEVPIADADPVSSPSAEVGVDSAWTQVLNRLEAGTTSTSRGFVRLFKQIDDARTKVQSHWQLCCDETGLDATSVTFAGTSAGVATTAGVLTVIDGPD